MVWEMNRITFLLLSILIVSCSKNDAADNGFEDFENLSEFLLKRTHEKDADRKSVV